MRVLVACEESQKEVKMITREEIRKEYEQLTCKQVHLLSLNDGEIFTYMYVNWLEDNLLNQINKRHKEDEKDQWISVDERLPEKMSNSRNSDFVLVTNGIRVSKGFFQTKDKYWITDNCVDPTHWMPLPKPPKTESK